MRRTRVPRVLMLAAIGSFSAPLGAQELTLKREIPPAPAAAPCQAMGAEDPTPRAEVESAAVERAQAMLDDASRITVLGELERARSLLQEASDLDPSSTDVQFRLARVNVLLDDVAGAVEAFCRVLTLEPNGADEGEAIAGIERLASDLPDPVPPDARRAFREGIDHLDAGDPNAAADAFARALAVRPEWAEAHYNRGLALLEAGDEAEARTDLLAYLSLRPDSPDRPEIAALVGEGGRAEPQLHPAAALAAGALVPGGGQLYMGERGAAAGYLLAAAASVGFGALHVRTHIQCRSVPGPEGCPPDDILELSRSRPLLAPGVAVGVAIAWIGAVRAYQHASGRESGSEGIATSMVGDTPVAVSPIVESAGVGLQAMVGVRF